MDFWTFREKVWQGWQNCKPRARRKFSKQNIFLNEEQFICCFCCFLAEVPRDFGEKLWQGCQNCSTRFDGNFYGNSKLFRKIVTFFYLCLDFERKEFGFLTKMRHGCKCSIVNYNFLPTTKSVSKISLDLEPGFSKFWALSDFSGRFVKIAFYVSGAIFWGSKFFFQVVFFHACVRNLGQKIFGAQTYFWS